MWTSNAVRLISAMVLCLHPTGSTAEISPLVVGGADAMDGQFPWMVALYYNDQFVCSATLISDRFVLTAAHCFFFDGKQQPHGYFHGNAGNFNRSHPRMRLQFENLLIHPNFILASLKNDIALLKTTHRITFQRLMHPLCLFTEQTKSERYHNVIAAGWGNVSPKGAMYKDILQFVPLKVIKNSFCSIAEKAVTASIICAAGLSKGACDGDSGGPLIAFNSNDIPIFIGIASYFPVEFGCGKLSMYTRVIDYSDFICEGTGGSRLCFLSHKDGNSWISGQKWIPESRDCENRLELKS